MPSPFPGMDPYIETPELWSDFHGNLASEIQAVLNRHIQPTYVARLTPYVTIEILSLVNKRAGHEAHRDYQRKRRTPPPPLTEQETQWLDNYLRQQGRR